MKFRKNLRRQRQSRQGFTLLELMLVMAILVLISSLAVVGVLRMRKNANSDAAATQINTLKTACKLYKLDVQRFPTSLNDLITPPSGMAPSVWRGPYLDESRVPRDPWQGEFQYSPDDANERVNISSNGPDGQAGTADDIPGQTTKVQ